MIIKSITNSNIFSFYGDVTFTFNTGLNLILAGNNQGKSQLFNSFNFGFFNRFFTEEDVDKNEKKMKYLYDDYEEYGSQIINRKFKKECDEGITLCGTSIKFIVYDQAKKTDIEYTLTRNIQFEKKSHNSIEVIKVDLNLETKINGEYDTIDDPELKVSDILPQNIQNYIWLKGESLDDLINFKNGDEFKDVVKTISHYPILDKIEERASKLKNLGMKLYQNESKKSSSKKIKLEQTLLRIAQIEKDLIREKELLKKEQESLRLISNEVEDTNQRIRDSIKDVELRKDYDEMKSELKEIINSINSLDTKRQDAINNTLLMSFGVEKHYDKGIELLLKYDHLAAYPDENEIELTPSKIEWTTPGLDVLNDIIKNETCELCKGPVKEGTKQWNEINARIKKQKLPKDIKNTPQFILASMKEQFKSTLLANADVTKNNIYNSKDITDSIDQEWEILKTRRRKQEDKIKGAESKLSKSIIDNNDLSFEFDKLKNKEDLLTFNQKSSEKAVERYQARIKNLKNELIEKEEVLKKEESKNEINSKEIKMYPYLRFFKDISSELKEREEKKLFDELETEANINYKNSLRHRGDEAQGGILTLNKDTGVIENIIDVDGKKEVRHGNKSNLVLMKLSIIESLIKFYSKNLGKKYPFIGDNFQASFDESTELAHLNKLNETFDQSIIIAKDHEHLRKLKGQKDISVGILKWDPPIEDEGITTIKML